MDQILVDMFQEIMDYEPPDYNTKDYDSSHHNHLRVGQKVRVRRPSDWEIKYLKLNHSDETYLRTGVIKDIQINFGYVDIFVWFDTPAFISRMDGSIAKMEWSIFKPKELEVDTRMHIPLEWWVK